MYRRLPFTFALAMILGTVGCSSGQPTAIESDALSTYLDENPELATPSTPEEEGYDPDSDNR